MNDTTSQIDTPPAPDGALRLPSGGWVKFVPEDERTGRHRRMVREAMDQDGLGSMLNVAYAKAFAALVTAWHLPYAPDLPLPLAGPQIMDAVRDRDVKVMEGEVMAWTLDAAGMQTRAAKAAAESDGGTPPQPASD